MKKKLKHLLLAGLFLWTVSCQPKTEMNFDDGELIHSAVQKLTDIIVYDIFSPPVASRIYSYSSIAAYEALRHDHPEYQSLEGQINGLDNVPQPEEGKQYNFSLASIHAFTSVGKALIFSEEKMDAYQQNLYAKYESTLSSEVYENSLAYGKQVADHVMNWAGGDNYKQTRTFPKFTVKDEPGRWQPTPPDYMDGIEPHWASIRTLVLDSAQQFRPAPPTPFSVEEGSQFYKEMMEVYETGVNLTDEQEAIAKFWDCNPYVSHHQGHVMFATKKITPGGHWMGITAIASRTAEANLMQSVEAYLLTSVSLMDGFISCWGEKYKSNLIRPETVINQHVDPDWTPLLQTPPFPEYTSGHSVISSAAAVALTHLYGAPFHFQDTTEVAYGLPPREFDSFIGASEEAAISRLYGGIHYMPACEVGVKQGRKVGNFIVSTLTTKKDRPVAMVEEETTIRK
ncbi:vanadium-dependent haloperoxidase [Catalinimonas niigatensis]|uniref:vanadium-dependent haloperoxidase n=1 Tax=Catalinimonas niigatensis TaxID=1397264 RepID=UPI002666E24E|nr:vanadium-dependent haloperoxidase [Catalinimonas niigatensis]WPP48410.1 vanadium-dependent haloperoxidase [Catalinimonas niigatensis]